MATYVVTSASYITVCGPEDPYRALSASDRLVDLVSMLPGHLQESEINDLMDFFQEFVNNLYTERQFLSSATGLEIASRTKLSILEKINRLTELHDPELVDIEYIQFFANYLGYNVDLSRGELGILTDQDSNDPAVQQDVKRYLRFVVSNLPNWYRIKSTRNAIKVMLFSFGLIGDILQRFTKDYKEDNGTNWLTYREDIDSINSIPSDYYPTPHFSILVDLDASVTDISFSETRLNVVKAINSIRPVNTVFTGITGYVRPAASVFSFAGLTKTNIYLRMSVP